MKILEPRTLEGFDLLVSTRNYELYEHPKSLESVLVFTKYRPDSVRPQLVEVTRWKAPGTRSMEEMIAVPAAMVREMAAKIEELGERRQRVRQQPVVMERMIEDDGRDGRVPPVPPIRPWGTPQTAEALRRVLRAQPPTPPQQPIRTTAERIDEVLQDLERAEAELAATERITLGEPQP